MNSRANPAIRSLHVNENSTLEFNSMEEVTSSAAKFGFEIGDTVMVKGLLGIDYITLKSTNEGGFGVEQPGIGWWVRGEIQGYALNKFGRIENTIEELVNNGRKYKVGDVVELLGYYSAGDGAGHKRKITSSDDGSGVQLTGGLWACIVHNGTVNVRWFGARSGSDVDYDLNTSAFKKALNKSHCIFVPNGMFHINDTLLLHEARLTGASRTGSFIKMMTNKHILDVGWRCCIEHIGLIFDGIVVENSIKGECAAIYSTGDVGRYMHFSILNDVQIGTCGYGILGNGFFSNTVTDLEIRNYKYFGIELTADYRTQNVWQNIYITSNKVVTGAIRFMGEETGSTINGLNIEHTKFTSDAIIMQRFNSTISNIHYEGVTLTTKNTSLLKSINSKLKIGKFEIYYSFFDTDVSSMWDYIGVHVADLGNTDKVYMPSNIVIDSYTVMGLNYQSQSGRLLGLNDPNLRFAFISAQADLTTSAFIKVVHYSYKTWTSDHVSLRAFYNNPHRTLITRLEFKPRYIDYPFSGLWGSSSFENTLRIFHNKDLGDEPGFAYISQPVNKFNTSIPTMVDNIHVNFNGYAIVRTTREDCAAPSTNYDIRVYNNQVRMYTSYSDDSGEIVANYKRVFLNISWGFTRAKYVDISILKECDLFEEYIDYTLRHSYWDAIREIYEIDLIEAYKKRDDQNQTYEEWLSSHPMLLPAGEEPQPSEALVAFKTKYLG